MAIRTALAAALAVVAACDGDKSSSFEAHVEVPDVAVQLAGRVVDAVSGEPLAGVTVRAFAHETSPEDTYAEALEQTESDAQGRFMLADRDQRATHLGLVAAGYHAELMRMPRPLEVDAADPVPEFALLRDGDVVGPEGSGAADPGQGPLVLPPGFRLPEKIRVGRTYTKSGKTCPPVRAVEELSLEEYVKGVVTAEIGVFRWTDGGDPVAAEAYKTLAVAARSYAAYYYVLNPEGNFEVELNGKKVRYHLDDTACRQRYTDARHAPINAAVNATRDEVLLEKDAATIDKYEYAASCGRHGTRPAHREELVADETGQNACVGSWCGHNDCAGHEGCVVRGICQWGSLERSKRGDTYDAILAHYQPDLIRHHPGDPPPAEDPPPMPPPPPPTPATDIITVDNTSPDRFRASGSWGSSEWATGRVGSDYRYRPPQSTSDPAEYKLAIATAGRYEVFTRIPGDGYSSDVPYIIHHQGGATTVHKDISSRGGQWLSLGTYSFAASDDWTVQISCWTAGTGYLIADAVRLEKR